MSDAAFELKEVYPVFCVRDLGEAVDYYRDKLGFTASWSWGKPPVRAGVRNGHVEIQLVCDPSIAPSGPSVVYCHMTGVVEFYRACIERGAFIQYGLVERPWGMKDFRVLDPSGNRLGFGELSTSPSAMS